MRHYSQNVQICIVLDILLQGEYNIPLDDNENGDDGGADLYSAPPGRYVPYQAPLPPAGPQGPPVSPSPQDPITLSDSTPPGNSKWPDLWTPSPQWRWAPYLTPQYWPQDSTGRGRQGTWSPPPASSPFWPSNYQPFPLLRQRTPPCAITPPSPTPQPSQQPTPMLGNPHFSSRLRRPVIRPDNTYGDEAPVDVFGQTSNTGDLRPPKNQGPDHGEGPSRSMGLVLHPQGHLMANISWEGDAKLIYYLLSAAVQPLDGAGVNLPSVSNVCEWCYRDLMHFPEAAWKEWKAACYEELESLDKCDVFELTDLPNGCKTIGCRWVFDVKTDGHKKPRLVAQGFLQVEGIDYNKLFSPVVQFESVHLMLTLATLHNWYMMGVDVHTAYLYGKLDEEIYMRQPKGFIARGQESKVICLKRALYGLKQAGLAWWKE